MDDYKIWKSYIKAQSLLIEQAKQPIKVEPNSQRINKDILELKVSIKDYEEEAKKLLAGAFPNFTTEEIDLHNEYIEKPTALPFNEEGLKNLNEKSIYNHLHFDDKAVIYSSVTLNGNTIDNEILNNLNLSSDDDEVYLTKKQIEAITEDIDNPIEIKQISCILRLKPEIDLFKKFKSYCVQHQIGNYHKYDTLERSFTIFNSNIIKKFKQDIFDDLGFILVNHTIAIKVNSDDDLKDTNFHYAKNYVADNTFIFSLNPYRSIGEDEWYKDFNLHILCVKEIFKRKFGASNIQVQFASKFFLRSQFFTDFLDVKMQKINLDDFTLNLDRKTIAFDLQDFNDFDKYYTQLKTIDGVDFGYLGDEHKFKVRMVYTSPLAVLKKELEEYFPSIHCKINRKRNKLSFGLGYETEEDKMILRDNLDKFISNKDASFNWKIPKIDIETSRYFFDFKFKDIDKEEQRRIRKHVGEIVSFKKEELGRLIKAKYPILQIRLSDDFNTQNIFSINSIRGELRGETEKIKRLSLTLEKIFSHDSKDKCINPRIAQILRLQNEIMIGKPDKNRRGKRVKVDIDKEIEEIKHEDLEFLNDRLNDKQKEAILGSLNAKDFYLIQGPPGTGKSTAISEITWQHISQNKDKERYKILVTSETNLAVDNALTKLRSPHHNLIKPIRFGSNVKLDKEGRQFSFDTFQNWVENNDDDDTQKCALQNWKKRVIKYAGHSEQDTKAEDLVLRWKNLLNLNQTKDKQKFYDAYIGNANVIGATCSSIGKENSIGGFTSFFWDYLQIFDNETFLKNQQAKDGKDDELKKYTYKKLRENNINFNLVIQDESSKASPAELALPLVYAQKAVVIGDHRQLPPMLNSNEFINDLNALRSKFNEKNNRELDRLIRDIKQNKKAFELSQFEKIYHYLDDDMKTSFNEQYRMHPDINEAIKQFYQDDSGLECGLPEELLNLKDITHPASRTHHLEIENIINPQNHIIWINSDTPELKVGTSRCNIGEVNVIKELLIKLENNESHKSYLDKWEEVEEKQIGIISFYGAQLKLLNEVKYEFPTIPMRISTVDKFQGMERNIIIVSTVRSNKIAQSLASYDNDNYSEQKDLGFAEFPNRLNVALSRAKKLLIIVGNKEHFRQKEIYKNLSNTIENLPNGKFIESTEI